MNDTTNFGKDMGERGWIKSIPLEPCYLEHRQEYDVSKTRTQRGEVWRIHTL